PSGFDDEITALGLDNFGNYIVGGYVTNSLFLNDPNVPVITNGTGDSDFWFGQLAKTDCAGVLLSNEDLQQSRASIYPNPAVNEIQINSDLEFSSVSIYNVNGQQVLTQILNSDQRLNISTLSNGVYFLKLENNGLEIETLKLVKE
ncbi:MAG: T9SS type A sorting domain-containing protein, partial [Nonlabens ulvanivorans]|uniref:T9SS type A sorting domain-containing protein n=1 Tax=Nonlabens ulvanivorans TaxID=906888 RepID=UPI003299A005